MSKIISTLAFATLLSLPASAAVSREVTAPRILVTNASASCPANEGYPDCHPDRSGRGRRQCIAIQTIQNRWQVTSERYGRDVW